MIWLLALATLTNGVLSVPPSKWLPVDLGQLDPGTKIEIEFEVRSGSRVQAHVVTKGDAERFHRGRSMTPLCSSGFERASRLRCRVFESAHYVLIADNRIEGRIPASVHLRVDLQAPPTVVVRELPPERRRLVVALSLGFFGAVLVFSARQFLKHN